MTLWFGDRKGIWLVKKAECWYIAGGDLTGALHVLEFWAVVLTATSRLLLLQQNLRVVQHSATGLPSFACRLAVKTSVYVQKKQASKSSSVT